MANEHEVIVRIKAIDEFTQVFSKFDASLKQLQVPQIMNNVERSITNVITPTKQLTKQVQGFKMEYLSLMFAGMGLSRVFGGLVRQQMELFGVNDMLSASWTTVLIPVMEAITPLIYKILDAFMNLPESAKMGIGVFVLFAAVLGNFMTLMGSFVLGWQGITMVLTGLFPTITSAGGLFSGLATIVVSSIAVISAVIAVVVGVVYGMYSAWKDNFMGMRTIIKTFVDGFKQYFQGLVQIFSGVLDILVGLLTGDADKITNGFKKIGEGFANFILGLVKTTVSGAGAIVVGAFKFVVNIVQGIINLIGKIPQLWGGKKAWNVDLSKEMNNLLNLPSYATGGVIPSTGPYYLHKGETVVPNSKNNESMIYSPTINVNANVSSSYDVRELAREVNKQFASEYERIIKTRGSM
jgi:hypothetical protein